MSVDMGLQCVDHLAFLEIIDALIFIKRKLQFRKSRKKGFIHALLINNKLGFIEYTVADPNHLKENQNSVQ